MQVSPVLKKRRMPIPFPIERKEVKKKAEMAQHRAERTAYRLFNTVTAMFIPVVKRNARMRNSELGKELLS